MSSYPVAPPSNLNPYYGTQTEPMFQPPPPPPPPQFVYNQFGQPLTGHQPLPYYGTGQEQLPPPPPPPPPPPGYYPANPDYQQGQYYQQPYQQQQQQQQNGSKSEGCCQTMMQYMLCCCAGILCYMCLCNMCEEMGDCMNPADGMQNLISDD